PGRRVRRCGVDGDPAVRCGLRSGGGGGFVGGDVLVLQHLGDVGPRTGAGELTMAIITPALAAARTSLSRRFPARARTSDGWIGDEAHRGTRSGHNPDETGNPEYRDDDNVDEVRAVDL